jgi:cytochrome b561
MLVLLAFPLGFLMVNVPNTALLVKFLLYQLHKTLGILVAGLVATRLVLRAARGRPQWDAELPEWQRRTAAWGHALLYSLLVAVPMLGYLTAATAPARIPTLFLGFIPVPHAVGPNEAWFALLRSVHRAAAILLVAIACGHAAVAVHNQRRGRLVLTRMWSGAAGH